MFGYRVHTLLQPHLPPISISHPHPPNRGGHFTSNRVGGFQIFAAGAYLGTWDKGYQQILPLAKVRGSGADSKRTAHNRNGRAPDAPTKSPIRPCNKELHQNVRKPSQARKIKRGSFQPNHSKSSTNQSIRNSKKGGDQSNKSNPMARQRNKRRLTPN